MLLVQLGKERSAKLLRAMPRPRSRRSWPRSPARPGRLAVRWRQCWSSSSSSPPARARGRQRRSRLRPRRCSRRASAATEASEILGPSGPQRGRERAVRVPAPGRPPPGARLPPGRTPADHRPRARPHPAPTRRARCSAGCPRSSRATSPTASRTMDRTSPEVVRKVEAVLERKLSSLLQSRARRRRRCAAARRHPQPFGPRRPSASSSKASRRRTPSWPRRSAAACSCSRTSSTLDDRSVQLVLREVDSQGARRRPQGRAPRRAREDPQQHVRAGAARTWPRRSSCSARSASRRSRRPRARSCGSSARSRRPARSSSRRGVPMSSSTESSAPRSRPSRISRGRPTTPGADALARPSRSAEGHAVTSARSTWPTAPVATASGRGLPRRPPGRRGRGARPRSRRSSQDAARLHQAARPGRGRPERRVAARSSTTSSGRSPAPRWSWRRAVARTGAGAWRAAPGADGV